jgi:hypothetical protein
MMRAENAPVYATKQAIRLPRVVLSMDITATRSNELEGNHSDGLDSVSAAACGGELTSPALSSASRAANALQWVSGCYLVFVVYDLLESICVDG